MIEVRIRFSGHGIVDIARLLPCLRQYIDELRNSVARGRHCIPCTTLLVLPAMPTSLAISMDYA